MEKYFKIIRKQREFYEGKGFYKSKTNNNNKISL